MEDAMLSTKMTSERASKFLDDGDRLLGTISGKWTSSVLDATKNAALLAGGLVGGALLSRVVGHRRSPERRRR